MLVKGNSVLGKKIVSIQKGREIDNVEDLIYDPMQQRVRALLVDKGGWFSDAWIILIEDVHSFGEDAVMIDSDTLLKKASDVPDPIASIAKQHQYLTQTKIITESGKNLGTVTDLFFDANTGKVHEFEVSQGLLKNVQSGIKRVKVSDIITVGENATIVKDVTEDVLDEQGQRQGLQGTYNRTRDSAVTQAGHMKQQAPSFLEETKHTFHNITERAKEKLEEFQENPKTQKVKQQSEDQGQQTSDNVAEKITSAQTSLNEKRKAPETQEKLDEAIQAMVDTKTIADNKVDKVIQTTEQQTKSSKQQFDNAAQDSQESQYLKDEQQKVADIGDDIIEHISEVDGREELAASARLKADELEQEALDRQEAARSKVYRAPSGQQRPFVTAYVGHPAPQTGIYRPVGSLGGESTVRLEEGKTVPPLKGTEVKEYELVLKEDELPEQTKKP